jgi:hypothetical protein
MTQQEIQHYIDKAIAANFDNYTSQSGEMMTSEGGDGRFLGKVFATRYMGFPRRADIYLVIGMTAKQIQIIKFGDTECIKPSETELDVMLFKELGIEPDAKKLKN